MAKTPPRFSTGNRDIIKGRLCGASTAEPRPCSARARISCVGSWANPLNADATVKMTTPIANILRGPWMSPSLADVIKSTA